MGRFRFQAHPTVCSNCVATGFLGLLLASFIAIFPTDFVLRLWHIRGYKSMPIAKFGLLRFYFMPFLLEECSI